MRGRFDIEWDPFAWYSLSPDRVSGDRQARAPRLSALDWWLLRTAYEVMASESCCTLCGAPLGQRLRVTSPPAQHSTSRSLASFATRCTGWRRHRHHADALEASGDLVLGPLTPTRHRGQA